MEDNKKLVAFCKKMTLVCIGVMITSLIGIANNLGIENTIGLGPYDIA